jgi:hypothetical protein
MCNAQRLHHRASKTRVTRLWAGSGPKNRRGGAPRGERPPDARTAQAGLRGDARRPLTPAGLRHWLAKGCRCTPSACRRSAPLVDHEGKLQTSEEPSPRENDDACVDAVARVEPSARLRASSTRYGETRERPVVSADHPDFASLNPGYKPVDPLNPYVIIETRHLSSLRIHQQRTNKKAARK